MSDRYATLETFDPATNAADLIVYDRQNSDCWLQVAKSSLVTVER